MLTEELFSMRQMADETELHNDALHRRAGQLGQLAAQHYGGAVR
jgi:hypothetical protein